MLGIIIKWFFYALSLLFVAWVIPGISFVGFTSALIAAFVMGVVNIFIRPILLILTLPINLLTLGLFTFVINALMLLLVAKLVSGFTIDGFWAAFFGAIVLSILSMFISGLDY